MFAPASGPRLKTPIIAVSERIATGWRILARSDACQRSRAGTLLHYTAEISAIRETPDAHLQLCLYSPAAFQILHWCSKVSVSKRDPSFLRWGMANVPNGHQKSDTLNSWKEIARYLNRGVRTVQRWERDLRLPVRRPRGTKRSAVFAVRSEIDAWLRSCPQLVS